MQPQPRTCAPCPGTDQCPMAQSKTVSIRCLVLVAVSRFEVQIGFSTASTSAVVIESTGLFPITGRAYVVRVLSHCAACLGLLQTGRRVAITSEAICPNVGIPASASFIAFSALRSAFASVLGSRPASRASRYSTARARASARETWGYGPSPRTIRLPSTITLRVQVLRLPSLTINSNLPRRRNCQAC